MLQIQFSGYFQARFATDDDPYDDPRGLMGWTFAVTGEPDFDRIIRVRDPIAPRSHGPTLGVRIDRVLNNAQVVGNHALVGTALELLDSPKFEGHNGDIAPDGEEPIFPLHVRFAAANLAIETTEWLAASELKKPKGLLRHGQGVGDIDTPTLDRLLGGLTPAQFRSARRAALQGDLATATGVAAAALQDRIDAIDTDPGRDGIKTFIMGKSVRYSFAVPLASRHVTDPQHQLGVANPLQMNWQLGWWMGAWDADALSGYVTGELRLS